MSTNITEINLIVVTSWKAWLDLLYFKSHSEGKLILFTWVNVSKKIYKNKLVHLHFEQRALRKTLQMKKKKKYYQQFFIPHGSWFSMPSEQNLKIETYIKSLLVKELQTWLQSNTTIKIAWLWKIE